MNKKLLYTLSTAFVLSGLTGCGANDEGATGNNGNNTNGARPIGYYSNENVTNDRNGNAILPDRDNDGPVTEILDRTGNANGTNGRTAGNIGTRDDGIVGEGHDQTGARNVGTNQGNQGMFGQTGLNNQGQFAGNGNNGHTRNDGQTTRGGVGQYANRDSIRNYANNIGVNNPTRPYANEDNGMQKDNEFSRSDFNYHGQLGDNNNKRATYTQNYNGGLAERISNRVENMNNVEDVRTIVNGNQVLVAIRSKNQNNQNVEQEIKSAIQGLTNGKEVRVVSDESTFTRARNIDNELRDGGPTEELDTDVRDMFNELGDAVRSPFRDRS